MLEVCHLPAVEVKQKASPARHDDPTEASPPASGRDSNAPIVSCEPNVEHGGLRRC